jgi:hypothetical protein
MACPTAKCFSTLSHKRHDFREKRKKLMNIKCFLIFSATFIWNIYHYKKNVVRYDQNVFSSSCKVTVILVRLWWNLYVLDKFRKVKFHENPSSGSRVRADRQIDRQTDIWRSLQSLFAILRTRLKTNRRSIRSLPVGTLLNKTLPTQRQEWQRNHKEARIYFDSPVFTSDPWLLPRWSQKTDNRGTDCT